MKKDANDKLNTNATFSFAHIALMILESQLHYKK